MMIPYTVVVLVAWILFFVALVSSWASRSVPAHRFSSELTPGR